MTEYKDQFTLDGRLKPAHPSVTRTKVQEADRLLTAALNGDRIASGKLAEIHTTSDLPFTLAHLISSVLIPQFDEAPREWSKIATVRTVPSFENVRLHSLYGELAGPGVAETGGLPRVPEATPYPYTTITGREAFYAKIAKSGAKFGFTWESRINDIEGVYDNIPNDLLQLALDTEEREVFEALTTGATTEMTGGTLPDGTVIPINAPISPNAIWQAIIELAARTVNSRKVGRSSNGYNVIVPIGTKDFIDWKLNQIMISIQDGSITYGPGDRSALSSVEVIESAYVTGTKWYVMPKPGGVRRPVLELGRLRGYEVPELRANGNTGVYLGSSAVVPFNEGSWDNDTIDYRVRYVCGGILWDKTFILYSEGDGTA
ncbi:MAG: hypothetical protein M0R66_02535 [Candidatus Omnitrophica bacterium]|jgi:hypothetical protein|nr:hypothetical protein [Sphaerochaeta sp.]MCK9603245.1 hypothetical protein [Candidatus Omnitrophota bacterium]